MTYWSIQRYSDARQAWVACTIGTRPYVCGYYDGAAALPADWRRYAYRIATPKGTAVERAAAEPPRRCSGFAFEVERDGAWVRVLEGSRDYCRGAHDAWEGYRPRPALRITRDGEMFEYSSERGPVRLA